MKTNHIESVKHIPRRPKSLPIIQPENLCKGQYRDGEKLCYTGWLLELFLQDDDPYVEAYKEFRCATMDVLYLEFDKDRAETAEQRSRVFNRVANMLGYVQLPYKEWKMQ